MFVAYKPKDAKPSNIITLETRLNLVTILRSLWSAYEPKDANLF